MYGLMNMKPTPTSNDILPIMAGVTDRDGSWYKIRENDYDKVVTEVLRLQECCKKYGKKVMQQEANMLKVIDRSRELSIQSHLEESYIKRLEAAYLEASHSWACSYFDKADTIKQCDAHAREALDKIREG
jgi:hypothetical protein